MPPLPIQPSSPPPVAVDPAGNAYLAGATFDPVSRPPPARTRPLSPDPISLGSTTRSHPPMFSPSSSTPRLSFGLGHLHRGTGADAAKSVALDASGNVWLTGTHVFTQFPNAQGWSNSGDFLDRDQPLRLSPGLLRPLPQRCRLAIRGRRFHGTLARRRPTGIVGTVAPSGTPLMRIFGIANAAYGPLLGRIVPGRIDLHLRPAHRPRQACYCCRLLGLPANLARGRASARQRA